MSIGHPTAGRLSRRCLLQAAAGAAALGGAAIRPATAQIRISQAAAGYQDHPSDGKSCARCSHFAAPDKCQLIAGQISPQGWCRLFTPSSGRAEASSLAPTS